MPRVGEVAMGILDGASSAVPPFELPEPNFVGSGLKNSLPTSAWNRQPLAPHIDKYEYPVADRKQEAIQYPSAIPWPSATMEAM